VGVVDELNEDVFGALVVGANEREIFRSANHDFAIAKSFLEMGDGAVDEFGDGSGFEIELDFAGFEASHLGSFLDEMI